MIAQIDLTEIDHLKFTHLPVNLNLDDFLLWNEEVTLFIFHILQN